ncbi:condensation domain-containing protein, partial [Duganella violaceipulchra]
MDSLTHAPCSTLLELLQFRASADSGTAQHTAFTYLEDGEQISGAVTFFELDRQARCIAAHLQKLTQSGDRVLLVYPPGLEYITAFFGCVYAGVIAVPALPPANARTLPRLQLMAKDAEPRVALTLDEIEQRIGEWRTDSSRISSDLTWLATDALSDETDHWQCPNVQASDTAFLQYTSGSTGAPKGVMVSHANILANVRQLHATFSITSSEVVVSWLPPHHDMGLIGTIIYPVYAGCHSVQFPPAAFLLRPYRWLKALSDYRGRITTAPNFAYELCVNKITEVQKQELDLSALEFALNGAEPIRADTMKRFAQAFAPCGLRPESFIPVYGLAESTLLVSANTQKQAAQLPATLSVSKAALSLNTIEATGDASDRIELVSTGLAESAEHQVIIVDPITLNRHASDTVGEIWVRGPSVAQGYWRRPEESQDTFSGCVAGQKATYLRTGDLGFIHRNELYITGRIKEMMIFNGRNIYPQDIEATVVKLDPAFRSNGGAVFALDDDGASQLVIIQEIESRKKPITEDLVSRLRAEISEQHEVFNIAAILLVKAGRIPRTSSGKIQRLRCKELFFAEEFSTIWAWRESQHSKVNETRSISAYRAPQTETEVQLAKIWEELLDIERISITNNFFALGGHSLLATQVMSKVRAVFALELPLRALFEAPTVEGLAKVIGLAQQEHVEFMAPAIVPADRSVSPPLSFAQQRLWFLDQLESGSAFYNISAAVRLVGNLDIVAFSRSLNDIVRRHEVLRTTFALIDSTPVQIITPTLELILPVSDLSDLPHAEREACAQWLAQDEAQTPFDLVSGPLIRARLLGLSETEHIALLTLHHIVSDGWSMGVMVRELAALYAAYVQDQPSPLPEPAIQYADFAYWQRQWLSGNVLQQQLGYWIEQLNGASSLLELPTDRPRPSVQSYRGAMLPFTVPATLTAGLHAVGEQAQSTLFMTLNAAFAVLLARYSGQTDICIGAAIANRNRSEIESLIGFFVNTLVLRARLDANPAFTDLLQQVRRTALEAYAHQDVPFEQLVEAMKPERHMSHAPLFQVMLVLQNAPMGTLALPGLILQPVASDSMTAKFDLTLNLTEEAGQLLGSFEYNTDLFDQTTIARMAGHFTRLLEGIVAGPGARIEELPLLSDSERQQLLVGFNATQADYPQDQLIQQLFEAQAAANPEAIAVVYEETSVSYGELNARANRLAHTLIGLGVQPDDRVAICVERSVEMIVGLLGILKAGGA